MYVLTDVIVAPPNQQQHIYTNQENVHDNRHCMVRAVYTLITSLRRMTTSQIKHELTTDSRTLNDIECGYTKKNV